MAIANSTLTITVMTTATLNAVLYVVDDAASPVDEDDAASHVVDDAAAPHVIVDAAAPHVIDDDAAPRSSSTPLHPTSLTMTPHPGCRQRCSTPRHQRRRCTQVVINAAAACIPPRQRRRTPPRQRRRIPPRHPTPPHRQFPSNCHFVGYLL